MANLDQYGVEHLISKIKSVIVTSEITYSKLKELRDSGTLIPGQQYRITDYVTTTAAVDTQSAGHQFDIIVTALDNSTLCEEAHAIHHQGDEYFDSCDLEAWKIWYCLENDTNRFAWADDTNGTGVIYRMIDEWGNDCPYDFKNIMFKKWLYVEGGGITTEDNGEYEDYCYTFSWQDFDDNIIDASIFGNNGTLLNDEGQIGGVYGNIIGVCNAYKSGEDSQSTKQYLNDIVFFSTWSYYDKYYLGCYSNTFGNDCGSNTFGNGCSNNTFGNNCSNNTFGDDYDSNTFGNNCFKNTFGYSYFNNTFGNSCSNNTFGNDCYSNIFGNNCSKNTFGNDCSYNTFGNYCYHNIFGNNCYYNTFGNFCRNNTFGISSSIQSYYRNIMFDSGNSCIYLYSNGTKTSSQYYQNVRIGLGVNNSGLIYKTITDSNVNQAYETLYIPSNSQTKLV